MNRRSFAPDPRAASELTGTQAGRLLPQTRFGGPIPWVISILIALVVVAAAGGLALRNLALNARTDLSGAVTIQIIEAEPELRARRAEAAAAALTELPQVTSVRIVPRAELVALLEPWLGAGADSEEIPIPALVDVELSRAASPSEVAALQAALDRAVPGTRIDAQSSWLRPVYDALAALQWLALGLIALVAFATAAAVWLAARSAFANHRETVEIIHLLGGTDQQVTRIFERSVLREASFGAFAGLGLGIAAVWLLGQQFSALDSGMAQGAALTWRDWLVIGAIPLGGIVLAMLTGRITISMALKDML
ncbi:MAG: FtsX-like permease family protein [Erythrobacter sp.]|jgi:cell division transport system permease protein|nr:FtsX-like permease family protein [Erythrobacter sp.]